MAQIFLDGLPQVNFETLPSKSRCMICLEVYGTNLEHDGAVEVVVCLPCGHHVGAQCIRIWLSPNEEARNSCPACRRAFFPAQPRPYMEHGTIEQEEDDLEDEEDDWHGPSGRTNHPRRANLGVFFLDVLRMVGEAGQPPRPGQEVPQMEAMEEYTQDRVRGWWPEFFQTTTEQYQESIRRARAVITTPRVPPPGASVSHWSPYPYLQLSGSESINPEEGDPQHLDKVVQALATAFRTLSFRETKVYSILRDSGARARFPSSSEDLLQPLSAEQEEALFREMERRGALGMDFGREYSGLNNSQRWQVHREDGETWNPYSGLWSPDWSE